MLYISSDNTYYNTRKVCFYPHYEIGIMVIKLQDGVFFLCTQTKASRNHHFTTSNNTNFRAHLNAPLGSKTATPDQPSG